MHKKKLEQAKYYRFSRYLKNRFGTRIYKIGIDAGFSCPNRDGAKGEGGCIYCNNFGFSVNTRKNSVPIQNQIREGMDFYRKRYNAKKFIIYFQAFTNTYADYTVLKNRYDEVRAFKDIVGISIGTRPDCIDENILSIVNGFTDDYEVWIEYGLQSIHDKTLKAINRNHSYQDFLDAFLLTRKNKKIMICCHVIIGLPGETRKDIINTAKELARLKVDAVKIHPMHIIKDTILEDMYVSGLYNPMEMSEFIEITCDFMEHLYPGTVIQRLTADCHEKYLVAPPWIKDKKKLLYVIGDHMNKLNKKQGRLYNA